MGDFLQQPLVYLFKAGPEGGVRGCVLIFGMPQSGDDVWYGVTTYTYTGMLVRCVITTNGTDGVGIPCAESAGTNARVDIVPSWHGHCCAEGNTVQLTAWHANVGELHQDTHMLRDAALDFEFNILAQP